MPYIARCGSDAPHGPHFSRVSPNFCVGNIGEPIVEQVAPDPDPTPTCDLCEQPQDCGDPGCDRCAGNWNPDTGNHRSCEGAEPTIVIVIGG